jgi:hypothetical protein
LYCSTVKRLPSGMTPPLYLPVSTPEASGDHVVRPRPYGSAYLGPREGSGRALLSQCTCCQRVAHSRRHMKQHAHAHMWSLAEIE